MKMDAVRLETRLRQRQGLLVDELDGEKVMMSVEAGAYFGLIATANRIWDLLGEPRCVSEVCEQLQGEFQVERAVCEEEVLEFLNRLHREGLVEIVA